MGRIKLEDLQKDQEISPEEMRKVYGGIIIENRPEGIIIENRPTPTLTTKRLIFNTQWLYR